MIFRLLAWIFLCCAVASSAAATPLVPDNLRCEYLVAPMGIDAQQPRLSWTFRDDPAMPRGQQQSAYRILVASSEAALASDKGDLWDSGQVRSDQSVQLNYAGKPLASRQTCFWKVQVWNAKGEVSAWSSPSSWTMGLLEKSAWTGQWIGAIDRDVIDGDAAYGYRSKDAKRPNETKWVQIDLGKSMPIDKIVLHPAMPLIEATPAGHSAPRQLLLDLFPMRFRLEVADTADFKRPRLYFYATKPEPDEAGYFKPRRTSETYTSQGISGRYVRMTATMLWNFNIGSPTYGFGLGEMQVFSGGKNVAQGCPAAAKDSMETEHWSTRFLTDGKAIVDPVADATGDAAILFRKEAKFSKKPVRATASICGLGYYELSINGRKVGDHVLDPGFTDYTKHVLYVTYDVTDRFKDGGNVIGVTLGNGWYREATPDNFGFQYAAWRGPLKLLLQIDLEFADGTRSTIVSDPSWQWSTAENRYNCVRGGETIDAREAKLGWDTAGYNAQGWRPVVPMPAPAGKLTAQMYPPIRVHQTIRPVKLTEPRPGIYVFDLGVNITGWARLQTSGSAGQKVVTYSNELLRPDGTVDVGHAGYFAFGRFQKNIYYLSGHGEDVFEPRFTYHGFRYVEVQGLTEKPTLDSLVGRWVTTDPEPAGSFACSNELINATQTLIVRTQLNNYHGFPSDCPHREKQGWMQDGCVTEEEAICNFQMAGCYEKWFHDMVDAQDASGHVGPVVPTAGWGRAAKPKQIGTYAGPWWSGAIVFTPWKLYQYYGDRRVLEEGYPAMKAFVDFMSTTTSNHIISWGLGDWLDESADIGVKRDLGSRKAPLPLTSTAAYFNYATILSQIAALLGKKDDAEKYQTLAGEIKEAYNRAFFKPESGLYARDSQTAQSLALHFGLVPEGQQSKVAAAMIANIVEDRKSHLNTGIIGTLYVFHALRELDRNDVAYAIAAQETYPSLGYMVKRGATSIWECWSDPGGMSHDHPTLGSLGVWYYQGMGGICPDPAGPGFKQFIIRPAVVGDLKWVTCHYDSIHGRIESNWKIDGQMLKLDVVVPPNTTATVYVPTSDVASVTESGRSAAVADGVQRLRTDRQSAVYRVGSGHYEFVAQSISNLAPSKAAVQH